MQPGTGRLSAAGERRIVTVLFADVSGFTAMSEQLDPEAVTDIVNAFFQVLTEPIYRFGGVVDKYIGDAIMALFGAPVAHEDDPERAVAAAWEMRRSARTFADRLEERTGIRLRIRIGINTGLVVAGAIGSGGSRAYTVMGDAVNLAQRMEANAQPGEVLVSGETERLTAHAWQYRAREGLKVKGKAEPVAAFDMLGPQPQSAADRFEAPFVGRRDELSRLTSILGMACAGKPQFVVVEGEAGIGKSRLASEFLQLARESGGIRQLTGRCLSYQQGAHLALLATLIAGMLGMEGSAGQVARERLRSWASAQLPGAQAAEIHRLADLVGYCFALPITHPELVPLSPEQLRNLAFSTIDEILLEGDEPRIIVLNDVQWADEGSRAWMASLCAGLSEGKRAMVLLLRRPAGRPEPLALPPDLPTHRFSLGPLARSEVEQLASGILGTLAAPHTDAPHLNEVLERSGGNPMFLSELVRALAEAPADAPLQLPSTVQGVIAARLDRLSPGARGVAQVAAVVGREFLPELVASLIGRPDLGAELAELRGAGLIQTRRGGSHAFSQVLIQEVAYQGLLLRVRKELHRRVGDALAGQSEALLLDQAATLVYHYLRAEEPALAYPHLVASARQAAARFANSEALARFEHAIALLGEPALADLAAERPALLRGLAEVEGVVGEHARALAHLEEAIALVTLPAERAALHLLAGGLHERTGAYLQALAAYEQALALDAADGGASARYRAKIAYIRYRQGEYAEGLALCDRALTELSKGTPGKDLGFCHMVRGLILWRKGEHAAAMGCQEQALAIRTALHDLAGMGIALNNMASISAEQGDLATAGDRFEQALAAFQRIGDRYWIATLTLNLGNIASLLGDQDRALARFTEALAVCRSIGAATNQAVIQNNLGEIHLARGQLAEAEAAFREAVRLAEELEARELFEPFFRNLGECLRRAGQHEEATGWLERCHDLAVELQAPARVADACQQLARIAREAGHLEEAIAWSCRAINARGSLGDEAALGRAYGELTRALRGTGRLALAADAYARACNALGNGGADAERSELASWYEEGGERPAR